MKNAFLQLASSVTITLASPTEAAAPYAGSTEAPITIGYGRDFPSTILGGVRRINVHRPMSAALTTRSLPVLVLLDGGEKEDFIHIVGLTEITAAWGAGQSIIVVGVQGVDRQHDLTSPSSVASDVKAAPTSGGRTHIDAFYQRSFGLGSMPRSRVTGVSP